MSDKNDFRIIVDPGTKSGSIPPHWDILAPGTDEAIITCWESREMAEECVRFLKGYSARRQKEVAA